MAKIKIVYYREDGDVYATSYSECETNQIDKYISDARVLRNKIQADSMDVSIKIREGIKDD